MWRLPFEDHDRDNDGEYALTESFQSALSHSCCVFSFGFKDKPGTSDFVGSRSLRDSLTRPSIQFATCIWSLRTSRPLGVAFLEGSVEVTEIRHEARFGTGSGLAFVWRDTVFRE